MSAEDVTVMEVNGTAVVTFIRSGDLSSGSKFNVTVVPGSATSRKLSNYHPMYECTHAWLMPG